jgi:hypothetical protein
MTYWKIGVKYTITADAADAATTTTCEMAGLRVGVGQKSEKQLILSFSFK